MAEATEWVARLAHVATWLERAGTPPTGSPLPFDELADLLRADYVQAPGALGVWFEGSACDTTKATLVGLRAEHLERMHRFVRLQRRLGWRVADLDRAIDVLGGGRLDEAFLVKVSHVVRLRAALDLPLEELLTWWGGLDTRRWQARLRRGVPPGAPSAGAGTGLVFDDELTPRPAGEQEASFYDRLFQPSTASGAGDASPFRLAAGGAALLDETQLLTEHLPAVAGALGVTAEDLLAVVPRLADGKLTFANLSALHRHVSLARALELTPRQLLRLLELTGLDPFDAAHPERTLALCREVQAIRKSGFSIEELDELLRQADPRPGPIAPRPAEVGSLLLALRDVLRRVEADLPLPTEEAGEADLRGRLTARLAARLTRQQVAAVMAVVDLPPGHLPPPDAARDVEERLAGVLDADEAKRRLLRQDDPAYLTSRSERLRYVLAALIEQARAAARASGVVEKLSGALGLQVAVLSPLLRRHLGRPGAEGEPLITVFTDEALRDFGAPAGSGGATLPTPADLPEQFAAYGLLHRVAFVLRRLRIAPQELPWVLETGPRRGTLDLRTLPAGPGAPGSASYTAWARLREAVALRDGMVGRELFDLFEAAAAAAADGTETVVASAHEALLSALVERAGWPREDVEFLVGTPPRDAAPAVAGALGFRYPDDWLDERPMTRLAQVMSIVRRVGLPAETLWSWRQVPRVEGDGAAGDLARVLHARRRQAEAIEQAVRARFGASQWPEVARSLRDGLRSRQRDALVEWLLAHDARFEDSEALFGHLLLDVETSPCQLTSRLKQAMSSVQLFVQRALMGLEPDVELSSEDAREWRWMKSYRL